MNPDGNNHAHLFSGKGLELTFQLPTYPASKRALFCAPLSSKQERMVWKPEDAKSPVRQRRNNTIANYHTGSESLWNDLLISGSQASRAASDASWAQNHLRLLKKSPKSLIRYGVPTSRRGVFVNRPPSRPAASGHGPSRAVVLPIRPVVLSQPPDRLREAAFSEHEGEFPD
jgi:hypothetical protein